MNNTATLVTKCAYALLAVCWLSGVSSATDPSRLNPAFLKYIASLSSSTSTSSFHVMSAVSTAGAQPSVHHFGLRPSPVDMSHMAGQDVSGLIRGQKTGVASAGARTTYDPAYDLGTVGKLTAVRNQSPYGDCWAFATYASMESNLLTAETWDFSENNLAMNSGFDWGIDDGGNASMSAAYLARWDGPVAQADDPNNGGLRTGLTVRKHMQEMLWLPQTGSTYWTTGSDPTFISNVKSAILSYGAVYSSVYWDDSSTVVDASDSNFYNKNCTKPFSIGGETYCTCKYSCSGHAIALVGWDDTYLASHFKTAPPGPGAFKARNSWGTGVGVAGGSDTGGYFYISYYDTSIGGESAVFNGDQAVTNYNSIYQYDPLGYSNDLGNSDAGGSASYTEWMSNIFTASAAGYIKAAGFYTTDINTAYTVYVYTGVTAASPRSGTLAYSASGTIPMAGFHTIAFGSNVPVSFGQKFSVVVRLTNPSYIYPVAVEYPVADYSSLAAASVGQSYFSPDGTSWTDMTSLWAKTNVCLKAYAFNDSTPPADIVTVNDGFGPDISQSGSAVELSANWTASADAESGIASYLYAIGTSAGDISVTGGWVNNGPALFVTKTGLSLINGHTYYFGVKAVNGVGLASTPKWSNGQTVDTTLPTDIAYVHDGAGADINYVSSKQNLSANWGSSSFSGGTIDHYKYAIGTTLGGTTVTGGWVDLGPAVYGVTKTGLGLTEGQTYYFSVQAFSNTGKATNIATSDGQTVDVTSPTAAITMATPVHNSTFSATLTITEAGVIASTPSLSFVAPDGELVPMTVALLSGLTWQGKGFMESYYSTGTATFRFSAVDGAGNKGSLIASGGSFLIDQSFSGASGGVVANSDGASVTFPPGAYGGGALYVGISTVPASRTNAADSASYDSTQIRGTDLVRQFTAHNSAETPVTFFSSSVTITLSYPDADGDGYVDGDFINENLLSLYYLDESPGKWVPLSGVTRNPAANTVSAPVSHFSVYSIRVSGNSSNGLSGIRVWPNPCDFRKLHPLIIDGIPPVALSPKIYIYNEAGELVRTLAPGDGIDGVNVASWDGKLKNGARAASGLYIYFIKTDNYGKARGKFFIIW